VADARSQTPPPEAGPLEQAHAQGASLLHRLDPRAKLPLVAAFALVVGLSPGWEAPWLGLGLGVLLVLLGRLGWGALLVRAAAVNLFVAFLWLFLPWRLEVGQGAWGLSLGYHPEGLALAGLITVKVNAVFLVMYSLLGTSSVGEVLHALAHFRLPAKLVTIFLLFHRYLFLIHQEYHRLRRAMRARCFDPATNLHTYRSFAQLVGMLLVRSYDRAERVYRAMLCRGFHGTFWVLDHFAWRRSDTAFCLVAGAVILGMLVLAAGGTSWS